MFLSQCLFAILKWRRLLQKTLLNFLNLKNTISESFVIEPSSIGLNVGLETTDEDPELSKAEETENGHPFGIPNTTLSLHKHNAYLKGLKYADTSCTAFLSPAD